MTLKIGSKVKIKENTIVSERADRCMKAQVGRTGEVIKIHEYDDGNMVRVKPIEPGLKCRFWWYESDLEEVEVRR